MENEIEFGEVHQSPPQTALRPDQDKRLAVVSAFAPHSHDLPVFVDLDTFRHIEEHAESDTTVELGGVLLGGQHQDESGNPFVVIKDCVKAEHYEATKGSFKFTHDTWQEIGRQRDEFPEELQMVGWYHTHPGWGIFLSGMDMFICENFFNKPLDLAMVVDPCDHDRGFFQWAGGGEQGVRRTRGYFVTASRFRHEELSLFVEWLEEKPMPNDPRFRGTAPNPYPAPVVQVSSQQTIWHSLAVLGTLTLQCCLVALIAWRIVSPPATPPMESAETLRSVEESVQRLTVAQQRAIELDAKVAVLDDVLSQGGGAPDNLVASLADRSSQVAKLQQDLAAHRGYTESLEARFASTEANLSLAKTEERKLDAEIKRLREEQASLKQQNLQYQDEIRELAAESDDTAGWSWQWLAVVAIVGVLCGGGMVAVVSRKTELEEAIPEESQEETV